MNTYIKSSLLSIVALLSINGIGAMSSTAGAVNDLSQQINSTQKSIDEVSRGINTLAKDIEQLEKDTDALTKRFKTLEKECPFGKLDKNCPTRWVQWGADGVTLIAKTVDQANKRKEEVQKSETYAKLAAKKKQLEDIKKVKEAEAKKATPAA